MGDLQTQGSFGGRPVTVAMVVGRAVPDRVAGGMGGVGRIWQSGLATRRVAFGVRMLRQLVSICLAGSTGVVRVVLLRWCVGRGGIPRLRQRVFGCGRGLRRSGKRRMVLQVLVARGLEGFSPSRRVPRRLDAHGPGGRRRVTARAWSGRPLGGGRVDEPQWTLS